MGKVIDIRKIVKFGSNSLAIILPTEYVKKKKLEKGKHVLVMYNDVLIIKPIDIEKLKEVKK
jgi:antitoxin component of MazEF toxin-antitoxin module